MRPNYSDLSAEQIECAELKRLGRHDLLSEPAGPIPQMAGDHKSSIDLAPAEGREVATGRFAKGWSGRPKGALGKATLVSRQLLEAGAEELMRDIIRRALDGDADAQRLCVSRLLPPRRDVPVDVELPAIVTAKNAADAMGKVTALVGSGELTPSEGHKIVVMIEIQRCAIETGDLERRILALEADARPVRG
ncbi:MAG: hypothetical protein EXQ93_00490 [Alphaproteobacteria bacterium]|nr:hypothetical protein [Alphaproteobacteria bacterium]